MLKALRGSLYVLIVLALQTSCTFSPRSGEDTPAPPYDRYTHRVPYDILKNYFPEKIARGSVYFVTLDRNGRSGFSFGGGFIFEEKYIITNAHVARIVKNIPYAIKTRAGTLLETELIGAGSSLHEDVAVFLIRTHPDSSFESFYKRDTDYISTDGYVYGVCPPDRGLKLFRGVFLGENQAGLVINETMRSYELITGLLRFRFGESLKGCSGDPIFNDKKKIIAMMFSGDSATHHAIPINRVIALVNVFIEKYKKNQKAAL